MEKKKYNTKPIYRCEQYPNLISELAKKGWEKKDLGAALGLDQTNISHFLQGKRDFTLELVRKIMEVLEIYDFEYLFWSEYNTRREEKAKFTGKKEEKEE